MGLALGDTRDPSAELCLALKFTSGFFFFFIFKRSLNFPKETLKSMFKFLEILEVLPFQCFSK